MTIDISRRNFVTTSIAATSAFVAQRTAVTKAETTAQGGNISGISAYQIGPQIWVRWQNKLLTSYRAHPSQKYPHLYPLAGPTTGLSLTSETSLPYPHHRSMMFACDRVNGGNYWQQGFEHGQIISDGPRLGEVTDSTVKIIDSCQWRRPRQKPAMSDRRQITITVVDGRSWYVDVDIQWRAEQDVTISKTNHSLFAIRAAKDVTPSGGGTLLNSAGQAGEKATFGQSATWCDFSGERGTAVGNVTEGIAILDHKDNPWKPNHWFTRNYGFISPTSLNFIERPWKLPAGTVVPLRYRVVMHAGDAKEAALDTIYKQWIGV